MGASRVQAGGRGAVRRRRPCVRREGSSEGSSLDSAWRKGLWLGAQSRVCEGRPAMGVLYMEGPLRRTC